MAESELIRRLDWRFLLPDPQLRRVAYIGAEKPILISALRYFSESVCLLNKSCSDPHRSSPDKALDLLVVCSSDGSELQRAAALVKPDGFLYWEIDRQFQLRSLWQWLKDFVSEKKRSGFAASHLNEAANLCELAGFREIEFYWHRPNFENCLDIVSLNDETALNYFFSRERADLIGKLKIAGGGFLNKLNLLKYLAPCLSLVACKRV
ncbi:MAG: hypothetical protein ACE5HS_11320 [bacterium]